jgi:hypothetical protein
VTGPPAFRSEGCTNNKKAAVTAAFLWLKSSQWITASFLQAFALRQVLQ